MKLTFCADGSQAVDDLAGNLRALCEGVRKSSVDWYRGWSRAELEKATWRVAGDRLEIKCGDFATLSLPVRELRKDLAVDAPPPTQVQMVIVEGKLADVERLSPGANVLALELSPGAREKRVSYDAQNRVSKVIESDYEGSRT